MEASIKIKLINSLTCCYNFTQYGFIISFIHSLIHLTDCMFSMCQSLSYILGIRNKIKAFWDVDDRGQVVFNTLEETKEVTAGNTVANLLFNMDSKVHFLTNVVCECLKASRKQL